jgi:hypothetical protein
MEDAGQKKKRRMLKWQRREEDAGQMRRMPKWQRGEEDAGQTRRMSSFNSWSTT